MNKNLFSIAALLLLLAFGLTGCKEDDKEPQKNMVKIGAQSNATIGSFYSLSEGKVYTQALAYDNQAKIDLLCFYEHVEPNRINDMTLSSPGGGISGIFTGDTDIANYTTKNFTPITAPAIDITVAQFDQLSDNEAIIMTYFNAALTSGNRKVKLLAINNIYAFKTHDGTYGLFKITGVSVPENVNGWIEFELKTYKSTL